MPTNCNRVAELTQGFDAVVISHSSTASLLSDDASFPRVVRAVPAERWQSEGLVALCEQLGWRAVAIVHEDSTWGVEATADFRSRFLAGVRTVLIDLEWRGSDTGRTIVEGFLRELRKARARIVILAISPSKQRELFTAAFETRESDELGVWGAGHAFLTAWASRSIYINDDGLINTTAFKVESLD